MKTILLVSLLATSFTTQAEKFIYDCKYADEGLSVKYELDSSNMKARIIAKDGYTADVMPVVNQHTAITFIEITKSGNVMTTTILSNGEATSSRHFVSNEGKIIPSQQKGFCTVALTIKAG